MSEMIVPKNSISKVIYDPMEIAGDFKYIKKEKNIFRKEDKGYVIMEDSYPSISYEVIGRIEDYKEPFIYLDRDGNSNQNITLVKIDTVDTTFSIKSYNSFLVDVETFQLYWRPCIIIHLNDSSSLRLFHNNDYFCYGEFLSIGRAMEDNKTFRFISTEDKSYSNSYSLRGV